MMRVFQNLVIAVFLFFSFNSFAQNSSQYCTITKEFTDQILQQVKNKNPDALKTLPDCFKSDRDLILKVVLIDASQLQNASEILKEDENFMHRLLKISPEILQYASIKLRLDPTFMENSTYLSRNALQYADPKLLDNKLFMKKMIKIDSQNYVFASNRLKEIPELAQMAFLDNGALLISAPQKIKADKSLVKIAVESESSSIAYASDEIKNDKDFKFAQKDYSPALDKNLETFLEKNYISQDGKKNLVPTIGNRAKFFPKNKIIERNYITKWQGSLGADNEKIDDDLRLISARSRNYSNNWKSDLRKYPELIKKIEKFFLNHKIDQNTIDNLSLTYLWKIKDKPLTLAFNLYLLRNSSEADFGQKFSDVTSLTGIVQIKPEGKKKDKNKIEMSVVEVIFANEIKTDINYPNGHKKYVLWDLYKPNNNNKNLKIIFKVEDRFQEYFEVFEEENNGKYKISHRTKYF
jgi:hypothetical protein